MRQTIGSPSSFVQGDAILEDVAWDFATGPISVDHLYPGGDFARKMTENPEG